MSSVLPCQKLCVWSGGNHPPRLLKWPLCPLLERCPLPLPPLWPCPRGDWKLLKIWVDMILTRYVLKEHTRFPDCVDDCAQLEEYAQQLRSFPDFLCANQSSRGAEVAQLHQHPPICGAAQLQGLLRRWCVAAPFPSDGRNVRVSYIRIKCLAVFIGILFFTSIISGINEQWDEFKKKYAESEKNPKKSTVFSSFDVIFEQFVMMFF